MNENLFPLSTNFPGSLKVSEVIHNHNFDRSASSIYSYLMHVKSPHYFLTICRQITKRHTLWRQLFQYEKVNDSFGLRLPTMLIKTIIWYLCIDINAFDKKVNSLFYYASLGPYAKVRFVRLSILGHWDWDCPSVIGCLKGLDIYVWLFKAFDCFGMNSTRSWPRN